VKAAGIRQFGAPLLVQGVLTVSVGERFPLEQGAAALAQVEHGSHGSAVVLHVRPVALPGQGGHGVRSQPGQVR
jgi:hypothetical protein